ncbi:MAG: PDZ domain-containing protein [Fimbriimonadaceae bacterium]|nr:PDZ domain-containing protein [Fimbriimonadaceae bacterium]
MNRLTALLHRATAVAVLAASAGLALAADLKERIEVPFRIAQDAIIVDLQVNGRNVSLMFDSGFSGAFLINPNVDIGRPTGEMTLVDFVGSFQAPTVPVRSVQFGSKKLDISDMTIVKMDMSGLTSSYGTHCDGILGYEVFAPYITEINFEKSKFIFHPRSSMNLAAKTPDNVRTFKPRMLPKGNNSIELTVRTASGERLYLALDTGNAGYATTHRDVMERVGLWRPNMTPKFMGRSSIASGVVESFEVGVDNADIYGVKVPRSYWNVIDRPAASADKDGTIGFAFLRNFNIIIDPVQRFVWMENFTGEAANKPDYGPGLYAVYSRDLGRAIVAFVSPESPAAQAGIKPGDHLLGIDGRELTNLTFDQIQDLLMSAEPGQVNVAISRGGILSRHTLNRVKLANESAK